MSYISASQAKQIAKKAVDNLKDGTLVPKLADNLTPYAEDSGTTQTQPFFLEGTATGNGESRVDAKQVPAYAFLQEKRGNMVCVNQLVDTNTTSVTLTSGHVYFLTLNGESEIVTGAGEGVLVTGGIDIVSDLTQWFNSNIPAYLLSHPEAFGRYYKGSLAYEPGRLEPATGRYLTSDGRNIWDEKTESGYWNVRDGSAVVDPSRLRTENIVELTPNTTYYVYGSLRPIYLDSEGNYIDSPSFVTDRTFTTPANCVGAKFNLPSDYGTTYKNDITISLYYPGESGYDKYYPHEVLATIDTGTESLYSAGSAYDSKVPSGLITRRIGSVDLGTLNWIQFGYGDNTFYTVINGMKKSLNVLTSKYIINLSVESASLLNNGDCWVSINGTGAFFIKDSAYTDAASFKAAMSGVMLYYELAEPTTEQGTPFQENVPIDDFGQLSWSNTDVPQGNQIFYPVDYKAAIDTLIKYMNGDMTGIAKRGSLADTDPQTLKALVDYVNGKIPAAPSIDGIFDLICEVTNGQPSYSWVART